MKSRQRTRLLDFLRLLWAQHQDESKDYHEGVQRRARERKATGLAHPEAFASAVKELRDRNPDRVRRTVSSEEGMTIVLSAPLKFALAWVAERLPIPADDAPLQNPELDTVIKNLFGDQDAKYPVLERAITAIAFPSTLTADHGVVPALNRFDEDGRTVELIAEMRRHFPDEATKGNWPHPGAEEHAAEANDPSSGGTMALERVSLPDLLCRLFAYHVRLENEFGAAVEREIKWRALDSAISSGDPVTMIEPRSRLPDKAVERYARIRDAAIRDAKLNPCVTAKRWRVNPMLRPEHDDKRVVLARAALYEPMRGLVRRRQDAAGRPVEKSNAWKFAIRWVSQRLDDGFQDACSDRVCSAARGSGVSLVEYYLDLYCRLELVPRVQKDGQFKQLAFAHDPIRRMTLEGLEDALLARGYDIVGEHHKLWEKRQDDAGFCRLEKTITRFDGEGKVTELLREVWHLHSVEAIDAGLPSISSSPSSRQVGEPASLKTQGAVRASETPETGLQVRNVMPKIRLFELLIKLRADQLDRESAWSKAIRACAKVIAKRAKRALTNAQRELIAKVDAGHLPPTGQDTPDGQWSDGLKEIDEPAYLYYQHRGNPESPACQILAENYLKHRNAPEWRRLAGDRYLDGAVYRFRTTPWRFVVGKLQAERGIPFTEVELFEAVRLLQLEEAEDVPLAIRQFIAQQDDSGYTNELLAGLWAQYRADAEKLGLSGARDTQPETSPGGSDAKIRTQRNDTKSKLMKATKMDTVKGFLKENGRWDGTYEELSTAIQKHRRITVSDSWLCRHRNELGLAYLGSPHRTAIGKNQREGASNDPSPYEGREAFTMPDDDDS